MQFIRILWGYFLIPFQSEITPWEKSDSGDSLFFVLSKMELEQIKNELQTLRQELIEMKDKFGQLETEVARLVRELQPRIDESVSPATRLFDTFKYDLPEWHYSSFTALFKKIQRFIFYPDKFTETEFQKLSANRDFKWREAYEKAKQAITELHDSDININWMRFQNLLAKDCKYRTYLERSIWDGRQRLSVMYRYF